MSLDVTRTEVWAASLEDRPGSVAGKLAALADAGANLEFVIARRESSRPGMGVLFVTPVEGDAQARAAQQAGFGKTTSLHSVRVAGPDQPGLGAKLTKALAAEGINLRGVSAASIGKQCVVHLALDSDADADKATQILKAM